MRGKMGHWPGQGPGSGGFAGGFGRGGFGRGGFGRGGFGGPDRGGRGASRAEGGWRFGRGGPGQGGPGRGFGPWGGDWDGDGPGFGGPGFGGPGGPGFGGRGGRKRIFDGGELRLLLLHLLVEAPRHGYELIKAVEELSGGVYAPSPGAVYPTLTLLRDTGLADEVDDEGGRKRYAATEAGQAQAAENREQVEAVIARLQGLGAMRERMDAAPVRRAMHNVKAALMERLRDSADRERVLAIAAILDEAAQKIERVS